MGEEVKVFRTWSSPFALRIIWALKLKGVEYDTVYEDISNKSSQLLHYNPIYKKVPVLVHHGIPIVESLVILEYIEETWKQNPLFPQNPLDRARARFWAKFGDDKAIPSMLNVSTSEGRDQEEAIALALENLKYLEEELRGKRFFGGEKIGYLDLALGWLANFVSVFEEVGGVKLMDEEKFPSLFAWILDFTDVPIIKEDWPPREKLITKFIAFREDCLAKHSPK